MKSYDLEFWSALYSPFCYGHNVRWRWSKSINNALESATAAAIKYNRIAQLIINTCGVPSMQTINYMCVYVSRAFEGMPRQVVRYCFRSAAYLISFTLRYIFLSFTLLCFTFLSFVCVSAGRVYATFLRWFWLGGSHAHPHKTLAYHGSKSLN